MEKKDWEKSLENLKFMKNKFDKDLEEINFTIKCYEKKVKSLKDGDTA